PTLLPAHFAHLSQTLRLKFCVANSENFINDHDLRLQVGGYGESQPHFHARTVVLNRSLNKIFDATEGDDLIKFLSDLGPAHAENGTIEKNILPPCKLGVKACSHFEEGRDPSINFKATYR